MYVSRKAAEAQLKRFTQRGQVPIVWGDFGVGKTSLVQHYFRDVDSNRKLVYITSVSGAELPDIFRTILEHLNFTVEVETKSTHSSNSGAGFDIKVLKANFAGSKNQESTRRLVIDSPTDTALNRMVRERNLTVVLDEMHKASDALRGDLADWIKATRANGPGFTLILVGTSTDAGRLVSLDHGIDRYVKEMQIDLMSAKEASWIADEGFSRLGLLIAPNLRDRLTMSAAGAPTIVQSLCLDSAESALADDRNEVTIEDLKNAVGSYLKENGGRLADHYYRAIETTGPKRYRKQILQAVAKSPNDYATMEDIRTSVSDSLVDDTPSSALSGPLRALKTAEFGKILKDVDREVSGVRIHNLTTFTDPMMKSYVRFMNNLGDTELSPAVPDANSTTL